MNRPIKEAATKKGRPPKYKETLYNIYPDKEKRTAQNNYYAALALHRISQDPKDSFFVTDRGNIRRNAILEQIGRLYAAGLATKDESQELLNACKRECLSGTPVKELERRLRAIRRERANSNDQI